MRAARAVACLPAEAGAHAAGVAVEVERDAADRALPPLIPAADWVETHDAAVLGGLHGRNRLQVVGDASVDGGDLMHPHRLPEK